MYFDGKYIVIENPKITDEEIEKIKKEMEESPDKRNRFRIGMTREVALTGPELFKKLTKAFPGMSYFVQVDDVEYDSNFSHSQVFTNDEIVNLMESNYDIEKAGGKLYFSGYDYDDDPLGRENKISFSKIIQSNMRMDNWVSKINNSKVDGKPLSPFEKYLYAYQIVTQFKYTMDEIFQSRDVARILSGKNIVCAGYTALLSELCRRCGIVCKKQLVHVYNTGNEKLEPDSVANHQECMVYLDDPKYNLKGFYISDPTNDSLDTFIEMGTSLTHALISTGEHDKIYGNRVDEIGKKFGERIMINELFQIGDFSNYYFLRDIGLIENKPLYTESHKNMEKLPIDIQNGKFDNDFKTFLKAYITNVPEEKRGNKSVTIQGIKFDKLTIGDTDYTIEQIANNNELLANLAFSYFSTFTLQQDPNTYILRRFFEKALDQYKKSDNFTGSAKNVNKLINDLSEQVKTNPSIYNDPDILATLAPITDISTYAKSGTIEKMDKIMKTKYPTPSLETFKKAMKVVYMARGDEEKLAEKEASEIILDSVYVADARNWAKRSNKNEFLTEAQKTRPVWRERKPILEKLKNILAPYGKFTVKQLNEMLFEYDDAEKVKENAKILQEVFDTFKDKASEEDRKKLRDLLIELAPGIVKIDNVPQQEKVDNTKIKTWGSASNKANESKSLKELKDNNGFEK